MSPYISPNKTIGGAITGIVISTITIIIIFISLSNVN
jgi:CDP-diglyceride synthetase